VVGDIFGDLLGPEIKRGDFAELVNRPGTALKHAKFEPTSTSVEMSRLSAAVALLVASADCERALGALAPKMEVWCDRQRVALRALLESNPEAAALVSTLVAAAPADVLAWHGRGPNKPVAKT
jgi:hypothetical protein